MSPPPNLTPPASPTRPCQGDPCKSAQPDDLSPVTDGSGDLGEHQATYQPPRSPRRTLPAVRLRPVSPLRQHAGYTNPTLVASVASEQDLTLDGADEASISIDKFAQPEWITQAEAVPGSTALGCSGDTSPLPANLPCTPWKDLSKHLKVTPIRRAPSSLLSPHASSSRARAAQFTPSRPDRYLPLRSRGMAATKRRVKQGDGISRAVMRYVVSGGLFEFGEQFDTDLSHRGPDQARRNSDQSTQGMRRFSPQTPATTGTSSTDTGRLSLSADFFSSTYEGDELATYQSQLARAYSTVLTEHVELRTPTSARTERTQSEENAIEWRDSRWSTRAHSHCKPGVPFLRSSLTEHNSCGPKTRYTKDYEHRTIQICIARLGRLLAY